LISELLTNFGARQLDNLKPFFAEVEAQAESTTATVRAACITFYKDAYKWIGEGVRSKIQALKKQ
jgi:hypothetical protein